MKIFTAAQIYQADEFTIEKQKITSTELMERAAVALFNWMHPHLKNTMPKIHLFCGIGNNGGDGIALARHLHEHDYPIHVYVVNYSQKRSDDFLVNLDRLKEQKIWPEFLDANSELPVIDKADIIVDAIFGLGLNRSPDKWVGKIIELINRSMAFVLSVDIPSGLFTDRVPNDINSVVRANHVLSIQLPKLVFFLPQTGIFLDSWELIDIGLDSEFLIQTETDFSYIERLDVLRLYRPRAKFSHKGTFGHSLLIGGSHGKIGAVNLAAKACLSTGSGLVSAFVPECGYEPLQTAVPEIMVITDDDARKVTNIKTDFSPTAVGIGMGLGTDSATVDAFASFLESTDIPLVLDADALNILAKHEELIQKIPKDSILTPHPKELERLIGEWDDDFDKLEKAMAFSKKHKCILVLKGAHTITLHEDKGFVNSTGNPGMATAGSGDVLAGMLTALLAQGYSALDASIFGVFLHGLAGDLAAMQMGYEALTASTLINYTGKAYVALFKMDEQQGDQGEG